MVLFTAAVLLDCGQTCAAGHGRRGIPPESRDGAGRSGWRDVSSTAPRDYVGVAGCEPTAPRDYVVVAGCEPTAPCDYVGVAGFEPTAPRSQSGCATKLRHTPWRAESRAPPQRAAVTGRDGEPIVVP